MRHLDLFSGLGGFALAASWAWGDEHEIVSFCDNELAAQVVLKRHWPEVPIHDDIKTLDAKRWRGTVDLVTGGFPCQPFSCAGKRRGAEDDRYLWPEMLRVIAECKPRWVLGENVPAIAGVELERCFTDLETIDYETSALSVPAVALNAHFVGQRMWIISHRTAACSIRRQGRWKIGEATRPHIPWSGAEFARLVRYETEHGIPAGSLGRVSDGLPYRVDRLRLLGNAIVPQVAAEIFRAMKEVDRA